MKMQVVAPRIFRKIINFDEDMLDFNESLDFDKN